MIHGDTKPQNVLVFKQESSKRSPELIYAKLADFGYSGWNKNPESSISLYLPRSRPWDGPEYHRRAFDLNGAKQLDIFSLGLTCFWFLFHDAVIPAGSSSALQRILNIVNLGQNTGSVHELFFENPEVIEKLKREGLLATLAGELINLYPSFDKDKARVLLDFFASALCWNPDTRSLGLEQLATLAGYGA